MSPFAKVLFSNGLTMVAVQFSSDFGDGEPTQQEAQPLTMADLIGQRLVSKAQEATRPRPVSLSELRDDGEVTLRLCTTCLEPIPHEREVCVCALIK